MVVYNIALYNVEWESLLEKVKEELHPYTKSSIFYLFSPSEKYIHLWFWQTCVIQSKISMIFFHWIYKSLMRNGSSSIFSFSL